MTGDAFVAVVRIDLRFPQARSLKAKRSELAPVKAYLRQRLGASIAEVAGHDSAQRATLLASISAGSHTQAVETCDRVRGWLDARFPYGAGVALELRSLEDLGLG